MNFIGANYEAIGSREVFDVLEHDSDRVGRSGRISPQPRKA